MGEAIVTHGIPTDDVNGNELQLSTRILLNMGKKRENKGRLYRKIF